MVKKTKQFIDRKNARHFHLVHRSQRDPLSRDESAPQRVLKEVVPANLIGKVPEPQQEYDESGFYEGPDDDEYFDEDDEEEYGSDDEYNGEYVEGVYDSENKDVELIETKKKATTARPEDKIGEAALLGINYDDGKYDYTQHLKEIGKASDSVFLAAPKVLAAEKKASQKSKGIQFNDASAAQDMSALVSGKKNALKLPGGVLQSREELDFADVYQSAMPEGLQPDMDPRLREVLEALEDEEYVEDDLGEDFFEKLHVDGPAGEDDDDFFEGEGDYEDYDSGEEGKEGWEADFQRFKKDRKYDSDGSYDDDEDEGSENQSQASRRKGGASASTFSMSSSAMFRNKNLTLLDERFDKIEKDYESDDDDEEEEMRQDLAGEELRKDFDSILDDFLDKFEIVGNKMVPRLEGATSENKLSTIRNAMLVDGDDDTGSVQSFATTAGGTRRRKAKTDGELPEEIQTDFRSRAERMRDAWDVQTILSTYSNLENHPALIKETRQRRIRIDPKTGMPIVEERKPKNAPVVEVEEEEEEEEFSEDEPENLGAKRNKAETKEEKKARKDAIKLEKKSRRETKKATKSAFAQEQTRQEKVLKNQKSSRGVTHLD